MPEGPEVALTAEILNKKLRNKTLVMFDFVAGRYGPDKTKPKGFNDFDNKLPMKLVKVDSKGKFMWMEFVSGKKYWYMFNTFGLKGMWSLFKPNALRAMLTFDDETVAYYSDTIGQGTFRFTDNKNELDAKLKSLPPDFLKDTNIDYDQLNKINKPIADILTGQKKIGSGIGMYLIAEILYRAKISPKRLASSLSDDEISELSYWIPYMMKLSYETNNIGYMINLSAQAAKITRQNYHPEIKLKKSDKKFAYKIYRQKKDPNGNNVRVTKIPKGNIYWVEEIQK